MDSRGETSLKLALRGEKERKRRGKKKSFGSSDFISNFRLLSPYPTSFLCTTYAGQQDSTSNDSSATSISESATFYDKRRNREERRTMEDFIGAFLS